MDYYTIDFETANASPTSACSIGIVGVKHNQVAYKAHYLINPEEPFLDFNISIHQITPEDVQTAPRFDQLWPNIVHCFTNTIVFSHNSLFDFSVLKALLDKYHIEKPIFKFGCTVKMARLLWDRETMPNHRLNTVAAYLNVIHQHHDALSDAMVCVDIISRGQKIHQVYHVVDLYDQLHLRFGYFGPKNFYNTYQLKMRTKKQKPKIDNPHLYNKLIILSGKPKRMKRQVWIDCLLANGAYVDTIVSNKCDILVLFDNHKIEKKQHVELLNSQGCDIQLMTEDELFQWVKQ